MVAYESRQARARPASACRTGGGRSWASSSRRAGRGCRLRTSACPRGVAAAHAGAAPRGAGAAGRRRRHLVHVAGAGPRDQREHAGARRAGPDPASRPRRAGAPVLARGGDALLAGAARGPRPGRVREIVGALDPLPAILTNGRFDILLSNGAHEDLFWDWHAMPCMHKNTLWCCLTEPSARAKFPQYERSAVPGGAAARRRTPGTSATRTGRRTSAGCPASARSSPACGPGTRWPAREPRVRTFVHPQAGPVTFTVTELEIPALPEARLTVYTPADEQTRASCR